jgi:hypothetical protein
MAKFETVPIGELKHRLLAKLLRLVEEYREKLESSVVFEKGGRCEGPPEGFEGGGRST